MIRFEKLFPEIAYPYQDAVAAAEYINGIFGTVSSGVFTAGAGALCVMQVEKGDDARSDDFKVRQNEHVRVADLSADKVQGQIVNITANELPSTYAVGNILKAASTGLLVVDSGESAKGLKIVEVTDYGVRAEIAY